MDKIRALVAAAGAGKRAGLPYPKTLHPVRGRPILLRLFDRLIKFDPTPTVIVSPDGLEPVRTCLTEAGFAAELLIQEQPTGMGDAVLEFERAAARPEADHLILVWGDLAGLRQETLDTMVDTHLRHGNDFTFVTAVVDEAYTIVERTQDGAVKSVAETRQLQTEPGPGERDIGLFIFRPERILALLKERLAGAVGQATGEHGFLYVIGHATKRGLKAEALPIAGATDLVSMNKVADVDSLRD
jgi:bifunctional UDP-N-acetylglucosamine pyrophosphorylase/glucosamine-1-phosphate N-acetyltransferase